MINQVICDAHLLQAELFQLQNVDLFSLFGIIYQEYILSKI